MGTMRNEHFQIATNHLQQARDEITECANTIYETLMQLQQTDLPQTSKELVMEALASLQMQDIITQRMDKLSDFLQRVDKEITLPDDEGYLEAFAWENEVDQSDIDAMFNDYKG